MLNIFSVPGAHAAEGGGNPLSFIETIAGWAETAANAITEGLGTALITAAFIIGVIYLAFAGMNPSNTEKGLKWILWAAVASLVIGIGVNMFG